MAFNSLSFLVFFTIVMFLHHQRFSWQLKKTNLLLASYVFYAAWNPPFIILLWISTLTDWFAAKKLQKITQNWKKFYLLISIFVNLSLLAYFKYKHFIQENIQAILDWFGFTYPIVESDLILPLGISFYTFQSMSYTIDVYRGKIPPSKSLLDFALYVTFFPQLVAGPIVRARDFLQPCQFAPARTPPPARTGRGVASASADRFRFCALPLSCLCSGSLPDEDEVVPVNHFVAATIT